MAKQIILKRLFGTHKEFFWILPRMLLLIRDLNLRMIINWDNKMIDDDKTSFIIAF